MCSTVNNNNNKDGKNKTFKRTSFGNPPLHLVLLHPSSHQLPQRRLIDLASPFRAQDEIISERGGEKKRVR